MAVINRNVPFPIYNADGESFFGLTLRKATVESTAMSLGDKISGDVYYKDNKLDFTMKEYIVYNDVKYFLVNPPTVVREGRASDNSDLKGMTKYSFEFYHPMYVLTNMPFTDVAVSFDELRYKSQDKSFAWIGYLEDYVNKLNKNLENSEWIVTMSKTLPLEVTEKLSEVLSFDNVSIGDALKTGYETWEVPYIIDVIKEGEEYYDQGKRYLIQYGLPSNEIFASEEDRENKNPFVFRMGQGVGLNNNSANPKNNKIVTRLFAYGSEDNIPYGYPQIIWDGNQTWDYTINNSSADPRSYPIYSGIVDGQWVRLIKHPFTRNHLMPTIYMETVARKVNPLRKDYNPDIEIIDYYDADNSFSNPINLLNPSCETHQFEDIKPELGERNIIDAKPIDTKTLEPVPTWDDTLNLETEEYVQSYFQVTLPTLDFDLYACAAITQEMQINMRSGACIGCTFTVQVDWDEYKANFYDSEGNFKPQGDQRDYERFPNSTQGQITIILEKETDTFGTLMPNIYQKPKKGDQFVILGISLPLTYVDNAQSRLDKEAMAYMKDNNVYYFEYPLKFDEYFLTQNTHILEQIRNNVIVYFDYASKILSLYVKQITIKYGDNVLPTYDITLTDDVDITINQIGETVNEVSRIDLLLDNIRKDVEVANLPSLLSKSKRDHNVVNYLKQALNQDSELQGGLLLTTLIALRDENGEIWSGINGAYDGTQVSGGIASWFGGAMVDYELNPTAEEFAKIVFRFDGSGYLAGGNISWDTKGNSSFKGNIDAYSGTIGGFEIARGRIGANSSYSGTHGLSIREHSIIVGDDNAWVSIGNDVIPYYVGFGTSTALIANHNSTFGAEQEKINVGLQIQVDSAKHNYGIWSEAPIRATSVYGTQYSYIDVSGSAYTIEFQHHNMFLLYASLQKSITLPSKSGIAAMFDTSTLPDNFFYTFTIVVQDNSSDIYIYGTNLQLNNATIENFRLHAGDTIVIAIIKDSSKFRYKILTYMNYDILNPR